MSYSIAKPSAFLSRYVKHYWVIDHRMPVGEEHVQRIVPNGLSDLIGIFPKQFLKIVRFQIAVHERSQHNDLSLTELAYLCGYYDQSHMIRDFQQLSGMTPKQYFQACESFSDYFQ